MMHVCCLSDGANKDTSSESKSKQHHVFTVLADMFWICDTGSRRALLQKVNTSPPRYYKTIIPFISLLLSFIFL